MAYTQTQLAELEAAYARGVTTVWLPDGSKLEFRSVDDMKKIINEIKGSLTTPTHKNVVYPSHSRGFQ